MILLCHKIYFVYGVEMALSSNFLMPYHPIMTVFLSSASITHISQDFKRRVQISPPHDAGPIFHGGRAAWCNWASYFRTDTWWTDCLGNERAGDSLEVNIHWLSFRNDLQVSIRKQQINFILKACLQESIAEIFFLHLWCVWLCHNLGRHSPDTYPLCTHCPSSMVSFFSYPSTGCMAASWLLAPVFLPGTIIGYKGRHF